MSSINPENIHLLHYYEIDRSLLILIIKNQRSDEELFNFCIFLFRLFQSWRNETLVSCSFTSRGVKYLSRSHPLSRRVQIAEIRFAGVEGAVRKPAGEGELLRPTSTRTSWKIWHFYNHGYYLRFDRVYGEKSSTGRTGNGTPDYVVSSRASGTEAKLAAFVVRDELLCEPLFPAAKTFDPRGFSFS